MKTCTKCKIEKPLDQFYMNNRNPDKKDYFCADCRKEYLRTRYQNNREKHIQEVKNYYAKNKEQIKAKRKARANELNPKMAEAKRKQYAANPQKYIDASRNWKRNNPEKVLKYNTVRRARKRLNGTFLVTDKDIRQIYQSACTYCGNKDNITMDHVIPLVRGGTHSVGNLVPACLRCNSSKSGRLISEWKLAKKLDTDSLL